MTVEVTTDLATIAARAVREGCIGETLAALALDDRIATTDDPVRRRGPSGGASNARVGVEVR